MEGGDPADGPYQTVLGEKEGYTLGELLYGNYTIPLTLSGMLSDCEQDTAAWQALHLDSFVSIDELTDFDSVSLPYSPPSALPQLNINQGNLSTSLYRM